MASKIEICNLALARIGQGKIASLTEQSVAGVACNQFYDISRRAVLGMHPWRFACKIATLAARDETVPDYDYSYTVPADSILILGFEPISSVPAIEYKMFGEALWTNDSTGQISYVFDQEDTNRFDPVFVSALAYYMAADLAPLLTGKMDMQGGMLNAFSATLRAAKGVSAGQARQPNRTGQEIKNSRL